MSYYGPMALPNVAFFFCHAAHLKVITIDCLIKASEYELVLHVRMGWVIVEHQLIHWHVVREL